MKKILLLTAAFAVTIISILFIAQKFFPTETFLLKNFITDIPENSFPASEDGFSGTNYDLSDLLKKGAVLDDSLMLINEEYPLPENYNPELIDLGGISINSCVEEAYRNIADDIKKHYGSSLYVMSAFRTRKEQSEILESGNEYAASVDSSEHLSGLALDVYIKNHAGMGFLDSEEGQFVNSNCHDYGFIIRYPYYGEDITGIPFEPWHLRYVGLPHAKIIEENNLTLEKYIESFVPGAAYYYNDYYISRRTFDDLFIPEGYPEIIISPDNTGYYFITAKK